MEPKDLITVWDAPDHSKLTPKQISIRLPILAAARIAALCDMYPSKSKSQIISDLIATALDQVQEGLPSKKGKELPVDGSEYGDIPDDYNAIGPDGTVRIEIPRVFEDVGPKGIFLSLTRKHLRKLEKAAGIKEPIAVPRAIIEEYESHKEK